MLDLKKVFKDIYEVSLTLFKIMIPTIIVVKILQEFGIVYYLNNLMEPLTSLVGLPAEIAIVITTTMLTNLYAGLIVFSGVTLSSDLTIAQATILATCMLFTHALPVEVLISHKSGARIGIILFLRVAGGFFLCFVLNQVFIFTGWLSEPTTVSLPQFAQSESLLDWTLNQFKGLVFIQIVIVILLFTLELIRVIGIEKIIRFLIKPFLKLIGIGEQASTIAVVGVTLGVSFGGGLLIKEVKSGKIPKKDVFGTLCFINLTHSVFEDTSLMMLLGANLFIILFIRAVYSMLIVAIVMYFSMKLPEYLWNKLLTNKNIPTK